MKKRAKHPDQQFGIGVFELQCNLFHAVAMLAYGELDGPGARQMIDEANHANLGVRGNRSPEAVMSWDDYRYLLAGQLRVALEHLEKPHEPE